MLSVNSNIDILSSDGAIASWSDGTNTVSTQDASFTVTQLESIADTIIIVTLEATTDATSITGYVIDDEPTAGQFEVSPSGGEVSLATGMSLDREQANEIIIKIK